MSLSSRVLALSVVQVELLVVCDKSHSPSFILIFIVDLTIFRIYQLTYIRLVWEMEGGK